MFLDQTRLWFSKGAEGDHMLAFIELSLDDTFKILDENSHTFAVRSTIGSSAIFRAKSRTDMALWRTALEGRSETVSENNLIAMADDHICQQELDRVEDNFRSLSSLSEFRGTLCNRYWFLGLLSSAYMLSLISHALTTDTCGCDFETTLLTVMKTIFSASGNMPRTSSCATR